MLLALIGFIAVMLTLGMFHSRNPMLGFPCVIFWALLGAQAYILSVVPWGDIYYYIAFTSLLGMTVFCALGAYGLRAKKDSGTDEDEYIDEKGAGADESKYIDETGDSSGGEIDDLETRPSQRTLALRKRAAARKTGHVQGRPRWGEFK